MVIRRVNPISAAKIFGLIGVMLGLIIGAFVSLIGMMAGSVASLAADEGARGGAFFGMLFGVGAIIILPIFYGVGCFIGGLIQAALFNLAAKWAGGLEIEAS